MASIGLNGKFLFFFCMIDFLNFGIKIYQLIFAYVLVQPELDKSLLQLRDKLAFGKRFF